MKVQEMGVLGVRQIFVIYDVDLTLGEITL